MAQKSVPVFDLYGEMLSGGLLDLIHYETIKDRSAQHNWMIDLHRHVGFAQIFFFQTGGVFFQVHDTACTSQEAMILFIPAGVPHGFHFPQTVCGDVLSLQLDQICDDPGARSSGVQHPVILSQSTTKSFADMVTVIQQIREAYRTFDLYRADLLTALVRVLLVAIHRAGAAGHAPTPTDSQGLLVDKFCDLVECHYKNSHAVGDYAKRLKLSPPHLNRLCRKYLKRSPHQLVRQRRLLEAKRLLRYTRLSIGDIANNTGFEDAAYFCRSFKSETGLTPGAYRAESANRTGRPVPEKSEYPGGYFD